MEKGTTGTITWKDKKTSKVIIEKILTCPSSGMPSDFVFAYMENETYKPLTHPMFNGSFVLPEALVYKVFKKD